MRPHVATLARPLRFPPLFRHANAATARRHQQVQFAKDASSASLKGKPVATHSQDALSFSRQRDVTVVTLAADERYDVPDALVLGA
jgi:hypothetical protein